MTRLLLDTNIPSALRKEPVPSNVVRWQAGIRDPQLLSISVVTLGEIQKGIELAPSGTRKAVLEDWFERDVLEWFAGRILPVTADIALLWGRLTAVRTSLGRPLHPADGLIAATALHHGLILVTRNVKDFEGLGLTILNPFEFVG